jgi:hypothetical protein
MVKFVIPAKAGIHPAAREKTWIPAFAGMTYQEHASSL